AGPGRLPRCLAVTGQASGYAGGAGAGGSAGTGPRRQRRASGKGEAMRFAGTTVIITGAARGRRIVNISSITFFGGLANLTPYVTSKGALVGLTRALARECGPDGVTVNAVAPGAFPTAAEDIHPDREGYTHPALDREADKGGGRAA